MSINPACSSGRLAFLSLCERVRVVVRLWYLRSAPVAWANPLDARLVRR